MRSAALALLCLVACAPPARPCTPLMPTCPTDGPPSFATDIDPLIHAECAGCHFPGSTRAPVDLTTYAAIRSRRNTVFTELSSCNMPPLSEPAMSDADRLLVLDWLACGAPDN